MQEKKRIMAVTFRVIFFYYGGQLNTRGAIVLLSR